MKAKYLLLTGLTAILSSSLVFAKPINLYDEPKAEAKQTGTINTDTGIIPIFTPKGSDWIKVGDPNNGNVGWIKQADLKGASGFSYTQRIITTGKGPEAYQVIQYGTPQMSSEDAAATIKRMEKNQQEVQKAMNNMVQSMFKNIEQPMPVILPVIYVAPPKNAATAKPAAPVKPTTAPKTQ